MRSPKGFRGRYFSLAAILAFSTTVTLANQVQSTADVQKSLQTQEEYDDENEELTPSTEELDVAVVAKRIQAKKSQIYSASKSYLSKTNVTDNVNILTSEEMKLQGFVTVSDALNSLPGISVTRNGGLGQTTSVFVQGFSNKYLLVLVDGVRYNDPTNLSGARLSTLLVDDIDKIEVIKGAQSGVWGADAAAGVINIITKKATPGVHASISAEAGSYKTRTLSTSLSKRTHTYDVMLSYFRTTSNGFSATVPYVGADVRDYESDPYRNTTINFKAGYWLDSNNRIEAGYHDINSHTDYDDSSFSSPYLPLPNSYAVSEYRSKSGYLKYKYFINRNLIEATVSQNKFDSEFSYGHYVGKTPSLELKDTYKYAKNSMLVVGGSLEKREYKYTYSYSSMDKEDKNRALFANNVFEYGNFVFSQALRYDNFSAFENKITGKIGLKYNFAPDFNVYANYGTAYETPSIYQLASAYGNPNLKPENIRSLNVGAFYKGINVNFFKNQIKDLISFGSSTYENVDGTSTLKGVELSYQKTYFHNLLVGTNYTYTDAKDASGTRLQKVPRYQIGINVAYSPIQKITLSADGSYIGSRDSYYHHETGRYFVANAKALYHCNKTFDVYLKLNNIFDRIYETTEYYGTARRSFYVGFSAKF
jgi:vitamin B12 transporter